MYMYTVRAKSWPALCAIASTGRSAISWASSWSHPAGGPASSLNLSISWIWKNWYFAASAEPAEPARPFSSAAAGALRGAHGAGLVHGTRVSLLYNGDSRRHGSPHSLYSDPRLQRGRVRRNTAGASALGAPAGGSRPRDRCRGRRLHGRLGGHRGRDRGGPPGRLAIHPATPQ